MKEVYALFNLLYILCVFQFFRLVYIGDTAALWRGGWLELGVIVVVFMVAIFAEDMLTDYQARRKENKNEL